MTTAIRRLALSYGMPTDQRPSDVLHAATLRRERDRRASMALAASIFNGIATALGGGSTDSIMRPFLSDEEAEAVRAKREEDAETAAQLQHIAILKRMAGAKDGRRA